MREGYRKISAGQIEDTRSVSQRMVEKAMHMRAIAYLAEVKASLLTQTIYEISRSKKTLSGLNADLQDSRDHLKDQVARRTRLLAASEAQYRALVEHQGTLFSSFLPDTTRTFVNGAYAEFRGKRVDELIGERWIDSYPEAERPATLQQLAACTATKPSFEMEAEIRRSDGEMRWIHWQFIANFDERGAVSQFQGVGLDITERKQMEALLVGQKKILELIAAGTPLPETLDALIHFAEAHAPDMLGSILLLDEDGVHIRHGAAPSLPPAYTAAVNGLEIGPGVGSCGTAAYRKQAVFVEDIATDPLWTDYKSVALAHGLRACWSTPILDAEQRVLGTFAMYYPQPGLPQPEDRRLIDIATHVASIAISRHRDDVMLQAKSRELEDYFTNSLDLLSISDVEGRFLRLNPEWERALGYALKDFEGRRLIDFVHPEDEQATLGTLETLLNQRHSLNFVNRYRHKNGSYRWLEWRSYRVNEIIYAVARDITERKKAEEALKVSEARLNSIFQASFDAIIVHQDFKVVFANAAALRLSKVDSLEAIVGANVLDLVAPDYREHARQIVQEVIKSGQASPAREIAALPTSGDAFPIEISSSPVVWGDGKAIVSIVRDITERKQAENELRQHRDHLEELVGARTHELAEANKHLQELDELKSLFIASMSHELRTPMNSILGFTDLILQGLSGEINEVQRDQLQRVHGAGKHLLLLITDIIDLSKVEAGKIEAVLRDFELAEMLDEALQHNLLAARKKGLELIFEPPVPDIAMHTDRQRLMQCLLNLLSNAVKYSNSGSIVLSARLEGAEVVIDVKDSGIGMSEEEQAKLFRPFVRIDSELSVKAGGTGLGLYLSKKLLEEVLGGSISVISQSGVGSCFSLRLPRVLGVKQSGGRV